MHCSFCGRSEDEVLHLIVQNDVAICDNCIKACYDLMQADNRAMAHDSLEQNKDILLSPSRLKAASMNTSSDRIRPRRSSL